MQAGTFLEGYVSVTNTEMEQSGIEVREVRYENTTNTEMEQSGIEVRECGMEGE